MKCNFCIFVKKSTSRSVGKKKLYNIDIVYIIFHITQFRNQSASKNSINDMDDSIRGENIYIFRIFRAENIQRTASMTWMTPSEARIFSSTIAASPWLVLTRNPIALLVT